jgi:hypothetical protein
MATWPPAHMFVVHRPGACSIAFATSARPVEMFNRAFVGNADVDDPQEPAASVTASDNVLVGVHHSHASMVAVHEVRYAFGVP